MSGSEIPISLLFASDLHFGKRSMDQEEMAIAFSRTISPPLEKSDIFFINGDFFDTLVHFDGHGFDPIYNVVLGLFALCEKYQITLRIMRGTWSHDRNQLKRFVAFYNNSGYKFDFKYIDSIYLEEIKVRDRTLKIFYTPDNLPFETSDEVVTIIRDKMAENGWDAVDYGCMHGFFDFTFPKMLSETSHMVFKESQFKFVKKAIDVGHVHQHGISGNVISNGSLDRLGHGEEDPKGCIQILDYENYYTAKFIENKHAAVFDTLSFKTTMSTDDIRTKIENHLSKISTDRTMRLRFEVQTSEQFEVIKAWMKETYPDIIISKKKPSDKSDSQFMMIASSDLIEEIGERKPVPTRQTISTFVRSIIPEDYILSIDEIEHYLEPIAV